MLDCFDWKNLEVESFVIDQCTIASFYLNVLPTKLVKASFKIAVRCLEIYFLTKQHFHYIDHYQALSSAERDLHFGL